MREIGGAGIGHNGPVGRFAFRQPKGAPEGVGGQFAKKAKPRATPTGGRKARLDEPRARIEARAGQLAEQFMAAVEAENLEDAVAMKYTYFGVAEPRVSPTEKVTVVVDEDEVRCLGRISSVLHGANKHIFSAPRTTQMTASRRVFLAKLWLTETGFAPNPTPVEIVKQVEHDDNLEWHLRREGASSKQVGVTTHPREGGEHRPGRAPVMTGYDSSPRGRGTWPYVHDNETPRAKTATAKARAAGLLLRNRQHQSFPSQDLP